MIKRTLKKIDHRFSEYCYHELKRVTPKPKQGLFNAQCMHNACHFATMNKGYQVVMGFYRRHGNNHCSLHFWVRKGKTDYEVSVGYECADFYYYEMKILEPGHYNQVQGIFNDALNYYKHKLTTPFERFIIGKARIC